MPQAFKILIFDGDAAYASRLVERVKQAFAGHAETEVLSSATLEEAKHAIDAHRNADAVLLDGWMPDDSQPSNPSVAERVPSTVCLMRRLLGQSFKGLIFANAQHPAHQSYLVGCGQVRACPSRETAAQTLYDALTSPLRAAH